MATKLTPQQIAAQTAKRMASIAARQANGGMTVRQARAAAKAAKAGQPFTPPPPRAPRPRGRGPFRTRRTTTTMPPPPAGPVFATPKPSLRPLRLAALVALEDTFRQRLAEQAGGPTDDQRDAWAKYKKVKTMALAPANDAATQNEADVALKMATLALVKLAF